MMRQLKTRLLVCLFVLIPLVEQSQGGWLTFEFPQQLERSKTFSNSGGLVSLSKGGVIIGAFPNWLIVTNDLSVVRTYPDGVLRAPLDQGDNEDFFVAGDPNHCVLHILASGFKDQSFASPPIATNDVTVMFRIKVQADGKILVLHSVNFFGGTSFPDNDKGLFRLNSDGGVDSGFQLDSAVTLGGLTVLADGRIQVGAARLLANGQRDPTWNSVTIDPRDGVSDSAAK